MIAIIASLLAILMPSLVRAKFQSKILATNIDIRQIGIALDCYYIENKKFPPTREDCSSGLLKDHLYQLPGQLASGGYLPKAGDFGAASTNIYDRFNRERTYKYKSVGECVRDREYIDKRAKAKLWVPTGFPSRSSIIESEGVWYDDINTSPVKWVLFSVGPNLDETAIRKSFKNRYPIPIESWYSHRGRTGFPVRIQLSNDQQIGTFQSGR